MIQLHSANPADTLAIGRRLAGLLQPGDVVLLEGRLGVGKTLFAAGIAEGLGVSERLTSPSFVLVKMYQGFLPLVHADVYRLGTTGEFADLELPAVAHDGVLLVEWGNVVSKGVPDDHLLVQLVIRNNDARDITLLPYGAWRSRPLKGLVA